MQAAGSPAVGVNCCSKPPSDAGFDDESNDPSTERMATEHAAALYRFALGLVRSAAEAEDLVQDAFLIAHRQRSQLREPLAARKWLYRILHNQWHLQKRRSNGRPKSISLDDAGTLADRARAAVSPVDRDELLAALQRLPEDLRAPVVLFYFDDLKYREIAEALDCPIGTVMSRLARGKKLLRLMLSEG